MQLVDLYLVFKAMGEANQGSRCKVTSYSGHFDISFLGVSLKGGG